MQVAQEDYQGRLEHFREACAREGIRLSHQRIEIFKEVAGSIEHPDAEEIYRRVAMRIPTISRDTVYRNLREFERLDLLRTCFINRNRMRFDANMRAHHHFVCDRCGMVRDFESGELENLPVPEEVDGIGSVSSASVELHGICRRCSDGG